MNTMNKPTTYAGMTPLEIKFRVYGEWGTITAAARKLGFSRSQLSYCILRKRISPEIRERLARVLGLSVEEMFGGPSAVESPDETTPEPESTKEKTIPLSIRKKKRR